MGRLRLDETGGMYTKICITCNKEKTLDNYRISRKSTGCRRTECIDCARDISRKNTFKIINFTRILSLALFISYKFFIIHFNKLFIFAFESIAMGRNLPTARSLKLFMMAVEKSCVVAYADFVYHKVSSLTVSASNKNLFCAIGNYIRSGAK